jgi:hypothetical protein
MACSVQRALASGANEFLEFGRFEAAIGHFHRALHAATEGIDAAIDVEGDVPRELAG